MNIAEIRAGMPALHSLLQINAGTKGICAGPVVDALRELTDEVELGGYAGYCSVMGKAHSARARLAQFFSAPETAMAFTGNASVSLNVALSLPWDSWPAPADVLISDHEYPTTNMLFGYLEKIGKARLIRFPLTGGPEALEQAITPNTKLIVVSHVDCNTGLRIDPTPLCAWARERNIVSYIDGAQATGQFPIDLTAMGCDLYITNGHKWLFGPNGVGLLYVRPGFEDLLTPLMVGMGTMDFSEHGKWIPGAHRFELTATRPAQVFATMNTALDWYESHPIEERQKALTAHVKARILSMPDRFRLITPLEWEESSALASIQFLRNDGSVVPGKQIGEFCGRMLTNKVAFIRPVPEFDAIRLSMAYYNIEEEYERFFEITKELS
ncbi:MAG: aminotransferase class V-fold PLP-dependent enzyme [Armatimonas sp.]